MAPSAANGDAIAVLEEIKAPPGVVLPPREIKGSSSKLYHESVTDIPLQQSSRRQPATWHEMETFLKVRITLLALSERNS
jgi:hypothetical protein